MSAPNLRVTPLNVLSGTPTPPLYLGFPHKVWVVTMDLDCHDDSDGDGYEFRLFVDEESARHFLRDAIIDANRFAEVSLEDLEPEIAQAQRDWVAGHGTTHKVETDGHTTTIRAYREEVWVVTPTSMKTLSLSRRDALGALGT